MEFLMSFPPMETEAYYEVAVMRDMELAVRFDPPLNWQSGEAAAASIARRFQEDSAEAIDVLDFMLHRLEPLLSWASGWNESATELQRILEGGGSVWDVTLGEEDEQGRRRYQLTRRVAGPADAAIADVRSASERAGEHLQDAWTQLLGTHPDPSAAYQAAVAAVEVAAKPVVSPSDQQATLGRILGQLRADLRDQPGRWSFELGDVQLVVDAATALWENQLRHGDEAAPMSETQEQADAAVALALTLVRWFTAGAIQRD
jgi:hypothetical protein